MFFRIFPHVSIVFLCFAYVCYVSLYFFMVSYYHVSNVFLIFSCFLMSVMFSIFRMFSNVCYVSLIFIVFTFLMFTHVGIVSFCRGNIINVRNHGKVWGT